jgi:transcriptional regulator with XRE-family HTH domain
MTSTSASIISPTLTAAQSRAARALLAWTQQELARRAKVGASTVADFERGQRTPVQNNAEAMRSALEGAGVSFLPGGAVIGPRQRPVTPNRADGLPMRWIDGTDLIHWADRRDAQGGLPELLTRLIRASVGTSAVLSFRADEGVQFPGWDGTCEVPQGFQYVPSGASGWEVSAQREGITGKATDEFENRTTDPVNLSPASASFVFVTPRRWSQKADWLRERRAERKWADVRAYDADDLVHWIELFPAVGHWLAVRVGKRPAGLRQLDEIWEEWSLSTRWPLSSELIRAGRDEEQSRVLRWLQDSPSVLAVQGESTDEAIAFLRAAIHELPVDYQLSYESRCLVATLPETARSLANCLSSLFVVLDNPDPGLAQRLVQHGHHVYLACGAETAVTGTTLKLSRPSRMTTESELQAMGLENTSAAQLARDCCGNLAVLRRLISPAPARLPRWAAERPGRGLLGALLAGSWDDSVPADREVLGHLAGQPFAAVATELAPLISAADSPIRKSGEVWKITSPRDAWLLLAAHLTDDDFDRLLKVASEIFSTRDPRFDLSKDERWLSSTKNIHPKYSTSLRRGIAGTLILFAVFGQYARCVSKPASQIDALVSGLLKEANREHWWSLSRDFQLLAEAAPRAFLRALEDALNPPTPAPSVLFEEDGGPFGAEHMSDLLWALEMLAWDPRYLTPCATILARLAQLDPGGGRYANRPRNSLRQLFLLWFPQTHATLEQRLRVMDRLAPHYPDETWQLMLDVFPKFHDASNHAPKPMWRELPIEHQEQVDANLIAKGADALSERLLSLVNANPERWTKLIEVLAQFSPQRLEEACGLAHTAAGKIDDDDGRSKIAGALRQILHQHRQLPDADWALPAAHLDALERIYDAFQPMDLVSRVVWLFASHVTLPRPTIKDPDGHANEFDDRYKEDDVEAAGQRRWAVKEILEKRGAEGIFALAAFAQVPAFVGASLADLPDAAEIDQILKRALESAIRTEELLALGFVDVKFRKNGRSWGAAFLARSHAEGWIPEVTARALVAFPNSRWTWDQAEAGGDAVRDLYWKKCQPFWADGDINDIQFAALQLMNAGRARHAIDVIGHGKYKEIPSDVLESILAVAAGEHWTGREAHLNLGMFQHYVAEILKELDRRNDLPFESVARLEWAYFPLLEHWPKAPNTLHKFLAKSPEFFVDLIKAIYRPAEGSGVKEEPAADRERASGIARQAFSVLLSWRHPPGLTEGGAFDPASLQQWTREARDQCARAGRSSAGDNHIGQILAYAPADPDGIWPAECVREVIEISQSRDLENGFVMGAQNKRGVTSRGMTDGGSQERDLTTDYRKWAKATALEWHRTSAALERIASAYEELGQWHDQRAERVEW